MCQMHESCICVLTRVLLDVSGAYDELACATQARRCAVLTSGLITSGLPSRPEVFFVNLTQKSTALFCRKAQYFWRAPPFRVSPGGDTACVKRPAVLGVATRVR